MAFSKKQLCAFLFDGTMLSVAFERIDGPVAQLGERSVRNAEVEGSIPFRSTIFFKNVLLDVLFFIFSLKMKSRFNWLCFLIHKRLRTEICKRQPSYR